MSRTADARRPAGCSTSSRTRGARTSTPVSATSTSPMPGFLNYDYTGDRPDVVYSVLLRRVTTGSREDDRTTRPCTSRRGARTLICMADRRSRRGTNNGSAHPFTEGGHVTIREARSGVRACTSRCPTAFPREGSCVHHFSQRSGASLFWQESCRSECSAGASRVRRYRRPQRECRRPHRPCGRS